MADIAASVLAKAKEQSEGGWYQLSAVPTAFYAGGVFTEALKV